ncbi:MAG: hypothetical protein M3O36_08890 [Myxococcota bacterium]|nr:hypothetical protein [Myxococcota bacterium]
MKVLFYATVAASGWRVARYFLGRLLARERHDHPPSVRLRTAPSGDVERWESEGGTPA